MHYELITDADFATLPLERNSRFLALEAVCRRNLNEIITNDSSIEADRLIRMQYMQMVASAAEELGIKGIDFPVAADPATKFDDFLINVAGKTTKLRLSATSIGDPNSVTIRTTTASQIEDQISVLKKLITKSDLDEDTKKRLLTKLAELSVEISKPRSSFSNLFGTLAILAMGVGGTTSFLADAPEAIATITALIGVEKQHENEEVKRLGLEKPKLLSAPAPQIGYDKPSDDEIPF
jgi:hypothetical protein